MQNLPRRTRTSLYITAALGVLALGVVVWLVANLYVETVMPERSGSSTAVEYVARSGIAVGDTVEERMIERQTVDETILRVGDPGNREDIVREAGQVVGHRALRRISVGERLYRSDFTP